MAVDERINQPWAKEVHDALTDLRQGDVIPWPADSSYVTSDRHVLIGDEEEEPTGEQFLAAVEPAPQLAIITTQTCDVDEQGRPCRKPWFQFAPVFNAEEADGRGRHTFALDGPELPKGDWHADLRIECAAEKNILVGAVALRGFATEVRADQFGWHLGHLRTRPALANHLIDNVTEHLRQYRKAASKGMRTKIREQVPVVLLDIQKGSRMAPHAVRIVAVHDGPPAGEVTEWFGGWYDAARPTARGVGIELHAVHHVDGRSTDYFALSTGLLPVDMSG